MRKILLFSLILIIFPTAPFVFAITEQVTVSAGDSETLRFYLNDGDKIRFWIVVSGGRNDDVNITIKNPNGGIINQGGIVESFNDEITASTSGNYYFEFDNGISLVSKKFVTFDYEIIKKPVFAPTSSASSAGFVMGTEWIWLAIIGLGIGIPIAVWKNKKKKIHVDEEQQTESESQADDNHVKSQNVNALRILKERLAKGEISKDEYDNLRKEFE